MKLLHKIVIRITEELYAIFNKVYQRIKTIYLKILVQVQLSLCLTKHHAMNTYWGSGDTAPRIL
jgi:hypothetical protein